MKSDEKEKKYKYTKKLLRIAIENGGYTNKDIAIKAGLKGTSTSLVSRWRNGKALATERQLQYFINEYEHLLRRKLEHLFYGEIVNEEGEKKIGFKKITGDIIFKHQIKRSISDKRFAVLRLVIIQNGRDFHVLKQYRASTKLPNDYYYPAGFYRSDNEEANWFFYDLGISVSTDEMKKIFFDFKTSLTNNENPIQKEFGQEVTMPMEFIFAQTMMKLGIH